MRKPSLLVCVVVLAFAAVACGSSGGSDATDTTDTTKAADATTTTESDGPPVTVDDSVADLTEDDYTEAFAANLSGGDKDSGQLVIGEDEAACVAPLWVDVIGVDALQAAGLTTDDVADPAFDGSVIDIDEDQGQEMVDAFETCDVDIYALFAESLTGGLTPEQQSCVAENQDKELVNELLVKTFADEDSDAVFEEVIGDLTTKCELPG